MMKFTAYLFIIFTIIISSCVQPDEDSPAQEELFVKYYGVGADNEVVGIAQGANENTWILYGTTFTEDETPRPYLLEVNNAGTELKNNLADSAYRKLFEGFTGSVYPVKVKLDEGNEEYLVAGYYEYRVAGNDIYGGFWGTISKSDLTANLHKIDSMRIKDIIRTTEADGVDKYLLLCEANNLYKKGQVVPSSKGVDIVLSKRDMNDSVYWEKNHGFEGEDQGVSIFEKSNGHLIVVGYTEEENEYKGTNVFTLETTERGTSDLGSVVKGVTSLGNEGQINDDIPYSVIENNGSYSIVGEINKADGSRAGFYMQIGADAIPYISYELDSDYSKDCGLYAATLGSGNGVVAVGTVYDFNARKNEGYLTRLSATGKEESLDQHYGTISGNDAAKAIITLPDGDLLVGLTIAFGENSDKKMALLRLNKNGELKN